MRMPGFASGTYESQSKFAAGERCINLVPEIVPYGNKTRAALYPAPGVMDFATLDDSPGRGIFFENDRLFAVFGETVYEIDSAGTPTARGTCAIDSNPAQMATNGDGGEDLLVVSGDRGDVLDLGTNVYTTSEVTDVTMCGQVDGFLVALDATTSTLKISESLDGKTWDPTQIAQRTAAADTWKALLVAGREIFLFGSKTGEVWYNAGNSPFPFAQRSDAFFEIGIVGTGFSLARLGSSMAWLGQSEHASGVVYQMNGYTPNRISTDAVEWAIQQYKEADGIDDAIGWSYEREGHEFYVLTFPAAGKTWVYDTRTAQWHERGRWSSISNAFIAYRPQFHAQAFGKNLVCDSQSNKIYALSSTVYTDVGGTELRRVRRTPHLSNENKRLFAKSFELECDRGVGLTEGQGVDPQLMLRVSRDGGHTFGAERIRSLGRKGEYDRRVRWDNLGSGRDFVFEVACADPVPVRLLDAFVEITAGRH
jgi:hypothetical protein